MKITLLGSLGNVNRIVVPKLIQAGHDVTVITTNAQRVATIEALGAHAAVGTMTNAAFLTEQFTGRDVVYLMISGTAPDLFAAAQQQAEIFKSAIQNAGVKKVVNLSSIAAQDEPAGTLYAYHFIEDVLSSLTDIDLAIVRPTGFYNNLYANLPSIKKDHAIYSNVPATVERKYVSPVDIAAAVFDVLTNVPAGKTIRYVVSDTFTGDEMIAAFREALALPDLKLVEITDDQFAASLRANGVPDSIVDPYVKSTQYQRHPEQLYADLKQHPVFDGQVKLADFAKQFAAAYRAGDDAPKSQTVVSK
ncbi:SDR family oxidoreductase [Secundilactobacillus similis]|uniref:NAD(P)-binding domain-containing protein n=1 Tax=Secundilactobacillus similis DSM 23365 = JCM 2765 TaxID=1423804 RepID=A0A0R2F976_9LACO|nr:NAD(P)H-binding protein [Secundilactobacillus similis]KRN21724.1 hypothetical protein FD14_GL000905 [Secundilactobacillus similis DSM 23365 = JCM 2765]